MENYMNNNQKVALYGSEAEIEKVYQYVSQIYRISYICISEPFVKKERSPYGAAYISLNRLKKKRNVKVIIASDHNAAAEARETFSHTGLSVIHHYDALCKEQLISSRELSGQHCFHYIDKYNNTITIKGNRIPEHFQVFIQGSNNHLLIGENVYFGDFGTGDTLFRFHGMGNVVSIGDGTSIAQGFFTLFGNGQVLIGKDCLISRNVTFHPVDGHHIFNLSTGRRINYPGKIIVGDHVWICQDAVLLGNAHIGQGSVLGYRALTSSWFGDNKLLTGMPAKVLRSDICWARDTSAFHNFERIDECEDQNGILYSHRMLTQE